MRREDILCLFLLFVILDQALTLVHVLVIEKQISVTHIDF